MITSKTVKQIETRLHRINKLEDKLQALYLSFQVTNDKATLQEASDRYNKLNLVYDSLTGREYQPK